ncbi:conserved hypothetical protein [Sporisorium reilianum SRZ2]|uniref:BTB domain-containing protein n=1 Tax=Sporisorium reilianum (strain SRZ2) TaxID=999809 RepID=E6ZWK3_SPORE|nr:conserved hypothetical protein [Sporisorium reilianum SRZ2]
MASNSANTAASSNSDSSAQPTGQVPATAATASHVEATATAASSASTAHDTTAINASTTESTVATTAPSEPQPAASSAPSTEQADSTAQSTPSPAPSSITTSSMLPRASGTSTSTSSSSSSGTVTPTARNIAVRSPVRSPASTTVSNRVTSNSVAATASSSNTTAGGRRLSSRHNAHTSPSSQRAQPFLPHPRNTFASALAAPYASNPVPSIFGFYSHDANAAASSAAAQPGSHWQQQATPRATIYQHHRAGSNSPGPARADQVALPSPISSPRIGNLSFYPSAAQRQQPRAPSNLGTAYRFADSHRSHASHSTSTSLSTDSSLLASSLPAEQPTFQETTTISFTWTVRDLHLLREEVELSPPPSEGGRSVSAGAGKSDVWTSQPVFGDNKWKLELVRTTRPLTDQSQHADALDGDNNDDDDETTSNAEPIAVQAADSHSTPPRTTITILSVYLTALVLDYTHANVEIPASIMVGLRPIRAAVGRRGAESGGYLWRRFYHFTFQKEADLFTCHDLPSVSEMLEDFTVARDNAIALTIQLGLGPGHTRSRSGQLDDAATSILAPVEVDGHHLVPRAVLRSLHGLLDDANTGDVRILVRERGILLPEPSDSASMSDDGAHLDDALAADTTERIVPFPIGSACPVASVQEGSEADTITSIDDDPDRIFVRDRVLWAHASVLKSRSDYFHTMLASDFSEGISRSYGAPEAESGPGRNVRTLQISDADFVTAYWFLRYLYTDDIQFADKEDVRSAVLDEEWAKGADLGYLTAASASGDAAHSSGLRKSMLVNWTPISQLKDYRDFDMDELSYTMPTSAGGRRDLSGSFVLQGPSMHAAPSTSGSLRQRTSAAAGLGDGAGGGGGIVTASGNAGARPLSAPNSPSAPASASGAGKHHTADDAGRVGSGGHRTVSNASATRKSAATLDVHDHPCADPGPASALSIFKLAHRYHMQDLSRLASLHMVATLTPQSAFPMLLATSMYTELHTRIKTYVYQHWHLVSHTQEFERCCDEVSVGMWGADAGKTMRAFVRSLVSPLRAAQG